MFKSWTEISGLWSCSLLKTYFFFPQKVKDCRGGSARIARTLTARLAQQSVKKDARPLLFCFCRFRFRVQWRLVQFVEVLIAEVIRKLWSHTVTPNVQILPSDSKVVKEELLWRKTQQTNVDQSIKLNKDKLKLRGASKSWLSEDSICFSCCPKGFSGRQWKNMERMKKHDTRWYKVWKKKKKLLDK